MFEKSKTLLRHLRSGAPPLPEFLLEVAFSLVSPSVERSLRFSFFGSFVFVYLLGKLVARLLVAWPVKDVL